MTNYILRSLLQTLIVTAVLSFFCYFLMTLMPGDPVDLLTQGNAKITSEDIARLRQLYELDMPMYVRYWNWIKGILSGDLGYSRTYSTPVAELLTPRMINTLILSLASLALSLAFAVPLAVAAALKPGSKLDYFLGFFCFSGISVPSFWLGLMLILLFSVKLGILPAGGTFTASFEGTPTEVFLDRVKFLILPTISLAYLQMGTFVRYTRSAMLEALRNDFIRTAKAKGLSFPVVVWKHAFRNALLPLITIVMLSLSGVFSGALITETVFAYQGVGKLVYDSIIQNDYNVAMVSFLVSIVMVLIMNLLADILYAAADPRISFK